jgi:hypothetical protein
MPRAVIAWAKVVTCVPLPRAGVAAAVLVVLFAILILAFAKRAVRYAPPTGV